MADSVKQKWLDTSVGSTDGCMGDDDELGPTLIAPIYVLGASRRASDLSGHVWQLHNGISAFVKGGMSEEKVLKIVDTRDTMLTLAAEIEHDTKLVFDLVQHVYFTTANTGAAVIITNLVSA
jgi:hypothetical protein